jgi:hypothetical protein
VSVRALGVVLLAVTLLAITYLASNVPPPVAHGRAVPPPNQEKCAAKLGPSLVQFSVYQARDPRARYCTEIPEVGTATIVIDQADAELRGMTTDVRIVKQVDGNVGAEGLSELSNDASIAPEVLDPVTEAHLPPKLYPTGIIEFAHTFTSPGRYHAMVTVKNEHGQVYVSDFPFSVGPSGRATVLLWGGLVAVLVAATLFAAWRSLLRRFWLLINRR